MLASISEKHIRLIRWGLTLGWFVLIASMFYDPISAQWTAPNQVFAATTPDGQFLFQGSRRPLTPYPMGTRIFWGMVLPLSILILLILGHEAWRRICPLSFLSQIPRALGWQRQRTVEETSWLGRNALYLQMGLLFIGLNLRLLLANSDRLLLGLFLLLTILAAITVGWLYDGKTWCHYFCPMAPVQMIYSEPSGLLGSDAHTAPAKTITQSTCRTIDPRGQEKSACVACKTPCIDIDAERAYWEDLRQPERKLLYYGYVGLVIGFYLYFWLYSGNWSLLSAGVWNETNQWATLWSPGFFIAGHAVPIPKWIAVPLTLTSFAGATYSLGLWLESYYKRRNQRLGYPLSRDQVQSRCFAVATFTAFNLLFFMGVRPTLGYLPLLMQHALSWIAIVVSSLWLAKTWRRSARQYHRERDANLLRRQLSKLNLDLHQLLEGRSLTDLNPDELYALAKVLPGLAQDYSLQLYRGVLREAFEQGVTPTSSLVTFQTLRQHLKLLEDDHWAVIHRLQLEEPLLFAPFQRRDLDPTVHRPRGRVSDPLEATLYQPHRSRTADSQRHYPYQRSRTEGNEDTTVIRPLNTNETYSEIASDMKLENNKDENDEAQDIQSSNG
ncbi:MAG: hypothetical protein IGS38_19105 [Synechococcales cyanobacterium M58_A2018_015]|nr:hypothetical protein [Synechococcales cyanobacterium M58_A2018_015]